MRTSTYQEGGIVWGKSVCKAGEDDCRQKKHHRRFPTKPSNKKIKRQTIGTRHNKPGSWAFLSKSTVFIKNRWLTQVTWQSTNSRQAGKKLSRS